MHLSQLFINYWAELRDRLPAPSSLFAQVFLFCLFFFFYCFFLYLAATSPYVCHVKCTYCKEEVFLRLRLVSMSEYYGYNFCQNCPFCLCVCGLERKMASVRMFGQHIFVSVCFFPLTITSSF